MCRDTLEIGGKIIARKGVVPTADARDRPRKLAGFYRFCPLEQQMFEKMRQTGFTGLFVGRTNPVPQHLHHDGGTAVLDHDDLKTVVERECFWRKYGC